MKLKNPQSLWAVVCLFTIAIFSSCDHTIPPPEQSISIEVATGLQNEYVTTRAQILQDTLGFDDVRDVTFSLDTLKRYIEYVEQEAKRQGKSNLGLRVHFAAYPQQSNYPTPGRATVLFLPTTMQDYPDGVKGFLPMAPPPQEILEGVNALNLGNGGIPPNDL